MPEKRFFTVCATNAEKAEAQPVIQKRRKQGMRNPKAKKIVSLIIIRSYPQILLEIHRRIAAGEERIPAPFSHLCLSSQL